MAILLVDEHRSPSSEWNPTQPILFIPPPPEHPPPSDIGTPPDSPPTMHSSAYAPLRYHSADDDNGYLGMDGDHRDRQYERDRFASFNPRVRSRGNSALQGRRPHGGRQPTAEQRGVEQPQNGVSDASCLMSNANRRTLGLDAMISDGRITERLRGDMSYEDASPRPPVRTMMPIVCAYQSSVNDYQVQPRYPNTSVEYVEGLLFTLLF